jgi:methylated-DNA-[protein]-cysteine S-methyltransferase
MIWFDEFATPIGRLTIAADAQGLRNVVFETNKYQAADRASWKRDSAPLHAAREQLEAYFAGERQHFDLPLQPVGTPFQLKVWRTLAEIPYGATWSYGDVAKRIGEPKAVRAVGAANGRNPLPIVLPCHRVIGSDGSLTGFGGGLPTKQFLLRHEAGARPDLLARAFA